MYKKVKRYNFCETLEKDVQKRADYKDRTFSVQGSWKKYLRQQDGFTVFAVDGEWVRNNLSVLYGHGGHGYVHEFIPMNEVWVSTHHYKKISYDCGCTRSKGGVVSPTFFNEVVIHEIAEFKEMEKGSPFWKAHKIATAVEKKDITAVHINNAIEAVKEG